MTTDDNFRPPKWLDYVTHHPLRNRKNVICTTFLDYLYLALGFFSLIRKIQSSGDRYGASGRLRNQCWHLRAQGFFLAAKRHLPRLSISNRSESNLIYAATVRRNTLNKADKITIVCFVIYALDQRCVLTASEYFQTLNQLVDDLSGY